MDPLRNSCWVLRPFSHLLYLRELSKAVAITGRYLCAGIPYFPINFFLRDPKSSRTASNTENMLHKHNIEFLYFSCNLIVKCDISSRKEMHWHVLTSWNYFYTFYISWYHKNIASDNLTLAGHLALPWPILRNGFLRRNWIEISLWCFRKTTTQNRCRGRRRQYHRPRIRGCSWQTLWCYSVSDELDMAHSLRRALFSVARKTHCENISFQHTM